MSKARLIEQWRAQVKQVKTETYALYLAYKDARVPWYAKVFAACVVGYAFSPIDLIPDFVPILGYLDDLVLVPLGLTLALKMMPEEVLKECRQKAQEALSQDKPRNWTAGIAIVALWLLMIALVTVAVVRTIKR